MKVVRGRHGPAAALLLLLAFGAIAAPAGAPPDDGDIGRAIYRQGLRPGGAPVQAAWNGTVVAGAQAACVNCHRRSGLGAAEGFAVMPPITGAYLFGSKADGLAYLDRRRAMDAAAPRTPYTEAELVRAMREGVDQSGRPLDPLMPRYALSDREAASMVRYLQGLSSEPSPGVAADALHFATIVAPGVAAPRRQAMLDVLRAYFDERNRGPAFNGRRLMPAAEAMRRNFKRWQLQVWQLEGPPETWGPQLRRHYAAQPVFAVVGGIGSGTWEPVHGFCQSLQLPCLFPAVDLPVVNETDFYSLYFSKGVLLEAQLLAHHLAGERPQADDYVVRPPRGYEQSGKATFAHERDAQAPRRIVQVFRDGSVGAVAARALRAAWRGTAALLEDRPLPATEPHSAAAALDARGPGDCALVLWLSAPDLQALTARADAGASCQRIYLSAHLSGGESAPLPPAWKSRTAIAYPFDLPATRAPRLASFNAWLARQHLDRIDEPLQAQTHQAAVLLDAAVAAVGNNLLRDHLVEQLELMVGKMPTGSIYPRLGLAAAQRFASKGGHIARFASPGTNELVAVGDWIVP